jgi:RimJ/RimL family protein N-acetyltransferase
MLPETSRIGLVPLDMPNLRRLATGQPTDLHAPEGALPPSHVASRVLAQLEAGVPARWCVPWLMVSADTGEILGGCRFKGAPREGCVEIGYGVAHSARRRGVATAAVVQLLQLAAASGEVRRVVAHIVPDNIASAGVVSRLGFEAGQVIADADGELVVPWVCPITT